MEEDIEEFRRILQDISQLVRDYIDTALEEKEIEPEPESFKYVIVDEFNYTQSGYCSYKRHEEEGIEDVWYTAHYKISKKITESNKYKLLKKQIDPLIDNKYDPTKNLDYFLSRLISAYLEKKEEYKELSEKYLYAFIYEHLGKPIHYEAKIKLEGIVLEIDSISLNERIILRRPKKEDFELKIPVRYYMPQGVNFRSPSAILELSVMATSPRELQEEIMKSIILLQLYNVGSIEYIEYRFDSESYTPLKSGTAGTLNLGGEFIRPHISEKDIILVERFWTLVSPLIPNNIFSTESLPPDHISISYQHYKNALFQTGPLEQRIAAGIMGLEALFLKSDERSELSYRLSIRISKIFELFHDDSIYVKNLLKDAYDIRSIYLHGDLITHKKRSKVEANSKKNFKDFLILVLDILRISIILNMQLKNVGIEKEDFIAMIDDSLIDEKASQDLLSILEPLETIFKINSESAHEN